MNSQPTTMQLAFEKVNVHGIHTGRCDHRKEKTMKTKTHYPMLDRAIELGHVELDRGKGAPIYHNDFHFYQPYYMEGSRLSLTRTKHGSQSRGLSFSPSVQMNQYLFKGYNVDMSNVRVWGALIGKHLVLSGYRPFLEEIDPDPVPLNYNVVGGPKTTKPSKRKFTNRPGAIWFHPGKHGFPELLKESQNNEYVMFKDGIRCERGMIFVPIPDEWMTDEYLKGMEASELSGEALNVMLSGLPDTELSRPRARSTITPTLPTESDGLEQIRSVLSLKEKVLEINELIQKHKGVEVSVEDNQITLSMTVKL